MLEKNDFNAALSQAQDDKNSQIVIPVKFNKEIINLDFEKAQELAQKGMKFDMISSDFEALKNLAKENGKNVGEYITDLISEKKADRFEEVKEKCGGDKDFAEHILSLENSGVEEVRGFSELKKEFPKIESLEALPESVVEAARLKGTLLLDEYLRFLHKEQIAVKESIKNQNKANDSSVGAIANRKGNENPEASEFLRGLWRK